jgi:dipeptidyl aminopeptidase/acylaminoacyl peptidase
MHNSIGVQQDDETQAMEVEGDRDFALGCMRRGIAALCIEQRSMGERRESLQKNAQGCHDAAMQAMMLGRTLIGERVYDVDRGIDYLASRGDANMNCVGVMGNSGGGTVSLFSAALLPRIAFAMPSACFCTFQASIMATTHCSCNYIPGLLKVAEMSDIMGLFAPKPVVIVSGKDDKIFPIQGARRAFKNLQQIYKECGALNRCHLVVGQGGHRFYADEAWPVMLREIEELQHKKSS